MEPITRMALSMIPFVFLTHTVQMELLVLSRDDAVKYFFLTHTVQMELGNEFPANY